jgi:hypothetical protein
VRENNNELNIYNEMKWWRREPTVALGIGVRYKTIDGSGGYVSVI